MNMHNTNYISFNVKIGSPKAKINSTIQFKTTQHRNIKNELTISFSKQFQFKK